MGTETRVELFWLPLGAGGPAAVRAGGWTYEHWAARREGRDPVRLFHSALRVRLGGTAYVIEVAPEWSQPGENRGVVAGGAVGSRPLGLSRWFRYEVRAWPDGVLPDEQHAVGGPRLLATDPARARRLLDAVPEVPTPVWGRDELGLGEMWNSNSVVAWLLLVSGHVPTPPPDGGRAPGWGAGAVLLERQCGRLLDGVRRHRAAGSLR
jgi:hypothetical protein